jgi:DNA-binding NarL/FixJ family response regulator
LIYGPKESKLKDNVKRFIVNNIVQIMGQIRVVLVDDHPAVRLGIRKLLKRTGDCHVVGDAKNGEQALQVIHEQNPDVVLLDIELPDIKGYEVARNITDERLAVKILALSAHTSKQYILEMFSSGAVGYITKEEVPQRIVEAIRKVASGEEGWLSPRAASQLRTASIQDESYLRKLSVKEENVLKWVAAGKNNQEIGELLGADSEAASQIVIAILSKLGANSRTDADASSI